MSDSDLPKAVLDGKDRWFCRKLSAWGELHLRVFPWRETHDPYSIFIAEFLLQQTDAPRVLPVYERFLQTYPTLRTLANADLPEVAAILRPLGFHFRASRLKDAARIMIEDPLYKGAIPQTETALMSLPGVGKYVARAICANAFGQSTAVIDTNVIRILQRFFGLKSRRARPRNDPVFWEVAQKLAPKNDVSEWNLMLLDFGATVCTSRRPRCSICPLQRKCCYFSEVSSVQELSSTRNSFPKD
jgi:A/G-specific adenine glycosylase